MESYDVVVIGAGISGLYAARCLHRAGMSILVLEGRDRIGGRLLRYKDARCGYADLGGAYVGRQHTKLLSVARELGVETYSVDESLKTCLITKNGRMTYEGLIPPVYNPFALLDMNNLIRVLDSWSKQVPLDKPWTATRADEWDQMTMQDFINKYTWTAMGALVVRMAVVGPLITEPHHVSLLFFLHFLRSCGGSLAVTSVTGGLQEMKFVGGSATLCDKMADQLEDEIVQISDGVNISTQDGSQYKAGHVVVALPPSCIARIHFTPPLPPNLNTLLRVPQNNHCIKTLVYYKERFWLSRGLSGQLVSEEGPVCYALDDTKADGSFPAIIGFINGDKADYVSNFSLSKRKKMICDQYVKEFSMPEFAEPVFYIEKDWREPEEGVYSGHCCVHSLPPGFLTNLKTRFGEPFGRIHFAGSESSTISKGYMDGALRSAQTVAQKILETNSKTYNKESLNSMNSSQEIPYVTQSVIERHLPSVSQTIILLTALIALIVGILC